MRPGLAWPSPGARHGRDDADWTERRDGGRAARPLGVENVTSTNQETKRTAVRIRTSHVLSSEGST